MHLHNPSKKHLMHSIVNQYTYIEAIILYIWNPSMQKGWLPPCKSIERLHISIWESTHPAT